MFTRYAIPVALGALMLAGRPALADEPGFLGVQFGPDENGKGVAVLAVLGDSPAEKAGLKPGDVITDLDGKAVADPRAFGDAVVGHKPGDEINLKVLRDGKEQAIKVKLGKRPAEPPPPPDKDQGQGFIGLLIRPSEGRNPQGKGVEVGDVLPDGPADKAGLKAGDVVAEVDGAPVTDVRAVGKLISDHKPGDEVTLKVLRDGKEQQVKVKVGKRPGE